MPWPDMPKHLAKDAFLQTLEGRYRDRTKAEQALTGLRSGAALWDIGSVNAAPTGQTPDVRQDHFQNDWFDNSQPNHTGWWINWKGDAEGTSRELLVRSLEVSLGLNHGEAVNLGRNRPHWPIEFFWVCGLPRFEGYVSWSGQRVTVILLTPGFVPKQGSPWRFPVQDFSASPDPQLNAWSRKAGQDQGIMFVGQNVSSTSGPFVEMGGSAIAHHLDNSRGGVGSWP